VPLDRRSIRKRIRSNGPRRRCRAIVAIRRGRHCRALVAIRRDQLCTVRISRCVVRVLDDGSTPRLPRSVVRKGFEL
jgi:hypothetical protein